MFQAIIGAIAFFGLIYVWTLIGLVQSAS